MDTRQQLVDDTVRLLVLVHRGAKAGIDLPHAALSGSQLEDLRVGCIAFLHQLGKVGVSMAEDTHNG